MPASSPRSAAWQALRRLRGLRKDADTPLPEIIDALAHKQALDQRDTRLLTNLVYGVLRAQKRLDLALAEYLRKPPATEIQDLLRLGAYELLFTDIPAHATVDQYVSLSRKKFKALSGLVNAVLRGLERDRQILLERDAAIPAAADNLALLGSLPDWLAAMWLEQYGPETALRLADSARRQPVPSYRVNIARFGECQKFLGAGFDLGAPNLSGNEPRFAEAEKAGLLSRQGSASVRAVRLLTEYLKSAPGLTRGDIWDACCGRGNKTCALLEAGLNVVLASDPSAGRLDGLRDNLARLGLPIPQIQNASLQDTAACLKRKFPVILLDAPCSGTGTLARNPELRLRLSPERLAQHAALQADLLDQAWSALDGGGLLAYLTCALNRQENEEQIRAFRLRHPEASLVAEQYIFSDLPGGDSIFMALLRA